MRAKIDLGELKIWVFASKPNYSEQQFQETIERIARNIKGNIITINNDKTRFKKVVVSPVKKDSKPLEEWI